LFNSYLEEKGLNIEQLSEVELYKHMSVYTNLPLIDNLEIQDIDIEFIQAKFNEDFIKKYNCLPLYETEEKLRIAVTNYNNYELSTQLKLYCTKKIEMVLCFKSKIKYLLASIYDKTDVLGGINKIKSATATRSKLVDIDEDLRDEKVTKKYINNIIREAILSRASDIHINPERDFIYIKFRIDGVIIDYEKVNIDALSSIMTTIKLFCNLDIAEKRKPQDGQFSISQGGEDEVNIRVAIINSIYGEKSTLRILNADKSISNLESLNIGKYTKEKLKRMITKRKGIVLVTGATGSGKSTTLKAVLNTVNTGDISIITIEDPVENKIENIVQTEVNVKAGVTFASGLRSILRLDPDIIMIGEIRDEETAEIAVRAAITGHMVYATLHTNTAINTVARLKDMGVEKYLLADSLEGIINQTLVKRVCPVCKVPVTLPKDSIYRKIFNIPEDEEFVYYEGSGCPKCRNTGYSGRILVSEALLITDDIKKLITSNQAIDERQDILDLQEFKVLKDDALLRVRAGLTDFKEVMYL